MIGEAGIPLERVEVHLKRFNRANPALPEIVLASLGDLGGLWGGLACLRARLS